MKLNRRAFLIGTVATGTAGLVVAQSGRPADVFRPEDFGARGDGRTNDSDAFAAMSDRINQLGGGTIELRRTTYLVGRQVATPTPGRGRGAFLPARLIDLRDLTRPLFIRGNGAILRCAPGLRYGTFDPRTGEAVTRAMPNYREEELAVPYEAMVVVTGCQAPVEISDLELDGGLAQLRIGGPYGDTGYQVAASGLVLRDNHSTETVRTVHSHHHALDGAMIDGDPRRRVRSRFENFLSEDNGRQGLSLVGGRGYDFVRCRFKRAGRGRIASAPGAGFDIEAEGGKTVRDLNFADCEFSDNLGCGMVADSGDSADAVFTRCTFVGTISWSAWPRKPGFRFDGCTFVGAISNAFANSNAAQATQFRGCTFLDDPTRAPRGRVYLGGGASGPIADLSVGENVLFDDCTFRLSHNGVLPWSVRAIYRDCTMSQRSAGQAFPRGTFLGRTVIDGNVGLEGSQIRGELVVNGRRLS